ncbi:signal recognition particle subunit FFH/SRP54 (srp54) [Nitrosococcus oceani ATCC 19707]|uniref:Signal recognition particle protein n=2 Tax=Nitrosococcus oceani TaxID=1229 RepID=Q3J8X7_NITOC|nr:signal recognition particle protein [Nitrosococcus oceani]ABA58719.1 signal recognition particle subunit FFH/SRP54 (srp54) [Nitrosococcus oceani ATCC 19707]EDZ68574.1 signal recognition particle protein [Nitrosococcus oceani AFC27]KFI18798.1 signal recognition particle [Nitrosococcus oceani C-27]GEM19189.1 signal recognition particle protein [Nitrosococcus oceani]
MFDNLTERLGHTLKRLRGQARLTQDNIKDTLREVRVALLEADVALPVVRDFVAKVRERAIGQEVLRSLTPGQAFIKIVHEELMAVMGEAAEGLKLDVRPPAVILMAGLQGSGKTTTVAKLARWLKEQQKKSVLVTSADVYRPAAIQQLETLANEVGVEFYPSKPTEDPVAIAQGAIQQARTQVLDVLIIDTAGRLHVDDLMMAEIKRLHDAVKPVETLFVVDSMTGQDAANTAQAFNDSLALTGVILTKVDGDARGGAALSIRQITGKPIKFLGVGEKTAALELFHPDRLASRILGMGDVLSLVEEVEQKLDKDKAEKLAKKLKKGKGFNLEDFRQQLQQMSEMGGVSNLLDKLPGINLPAGATDQVNDRELIRLGAIINSMTPRERQRPEIIRSSRKRRIAAGSGTQVQEVNRLLKQFAQMQKMMKRMSRKGGMAKLMRGMKGGLPPGMPF